MPICTCCVRPAHLVAAHERPEDFADAREVAGVRVESDEVEFVADDDDGDLREPRRPWG